MFWLSDLFLKLDRPGLFSMRHWYLKQPTSAFLFFCYIATLVYNKTHIDIVSNEICLVEFTQAFIDQASTAVVTNHT